MLGTILSNTKGKKRQYKDDYVSTKRVKMIDNIIPHNPPIEKSQLMTECAYLFDQRVILQRDILNQQEHLQAMRVETEVTRMKLQLAKQELEMITQQVTVLRIQHKTLSLSCQGQNQSLRALIQKNADEVNRAIRLQNKSETKNDLLCDL